MKIVFLCRRFYPAIGGVEKHVYEISSRLVQRGYHITVITEDTGLVPKEAIGKEQKKVLDALTILRIPVPQDERKKKFAIWQWLFVHSQVLKQADIVHAHDVFFWYLPFRFLFPLKKVFTTFHGYEGYPLTRKAIIVRKLSELLSRGNICIGAFIKKWYGTNPDYVSYGAVDSSKFKVQSSKFTKESAVFIGRLDEQTGIKTYTEAYRLLKKQYPKFEFLVVGEGVFKKNLTKDIISKGFDSGAQKYYQEYHFAFVSRYLTILEAMAAKRLVFAVFDNPIKRDYLKLSPMAAFMVIGETPKELADAATYYLTHPKNEADHIEKAYAWVKTQTWEKMIDTYLALWNKS